jgi:hypothetical protein
MLVKKEIIRKSDEISVKKLIKHNPHEVATLSIEECKKILGESNLSDIQIQNLRDCLSVLIDSVIDNYFDKLVQ